jgi:CHRD domain/Bacterial Ig domain
MANRSRIRQVVPTALLLAAGTFAAILTACGGGGYGGGGGGGSTSSAMSCSTGGGYGGGGSSCPAPTIQLVSPGATVDRSVTLSATASAASGASVTQVEFLIDGTSVGTVKTAPFTLSWDSTTVADGSHTLTAIVTDSKGQTTTSSPVVFKVDNNPAFKVTLQSTQIIPEPTSSASGTASLTAKLANGSISGKVTLSGVTATAVTINDAFAGNRGPSIISLKASAATPGEWDVPPAALLTADQVTALMQGELYVIAISAVNPNGEIRGQITPANISVVFTKLSGAQEVPAVNNNAASGVAGVTVDSTANTVSVHLHTSGIADASAASVNTAAAGATGARLVALAHDPADAGHWSVELAKVTAADLSNFDANKWYLNVVTATDPNGAVRGQIDATTAAPPPPPTPTLTQLATTVFQVCGGCHTGGGASLPASMNLTNRAAIYAALVNVPSVEEPNLLRVKPGDATDSYVVHKLEGVGIAPGTARMPFGGPYESQTEINTLIAWINAGAPNN